MEANAQFHKWQRLTCIFANRAHPVFIKDHRRKKNAAWRPKDTFIPDHTPQSFLHSKNLPTIPRAIHAVTTASLTWGLLAFFSRVWHAAKLYKPRIDKGHRLTVLRHIAPWGDLPRSEQLTDFTLPGFREIPISIQGQQPCFISHLNSFFFWLC